MKEPVKLADISAIPASGLLGATLDGTELVITRVNAEIAVLEGTCPHQGSSLADGELVEGKLRCAAHGWTFECASGKKVSNPSVCLKRFTSRTEKGAIWIDLKEFQEWKARKSSTSGKKRTYADLPGPKGVFFFGNALQLRRGQVHEVVENWAKQYGTLYRFDLPGKKNVAISDADLAQEILLQRPHAFRRLRRLEENLSELEANGLFSSEGASWIRQRRLTTPAFNSSHLKDFFPTLAKVNERLYRRWHSRNNSEIDVQRELMRFTVDVTTNLAFGYDMNTLEKEGDVIQVHLEKIFPALGRRLGAPFKYWRYFKLPADRELDKAIVAIKALILDIVDKSRKRMEANPQLRDRPSNFLEGFLAYRGENGESMSDEEILANVVTILIAGEDTTANALSWLIHHLTLYPEAQEKARVEVDRALGNAALPEQMAVLDHLPYLEATIHESMRLNPVASFMVMEPLEDITVRDLFFEKGTGLMMCLQRMMRMEENFSRASEFLPERWLPESRFPVHNTKAAMPFGAGPRYCPGRNLAMLEIKAVMAMVLKNFVLEKSKIHPPPREVFSFVTIPEGLRVHFANRGT